MFAVLIPTPPGIWMVPKSADELTSRFKIVSNESLKHSVSNPGFPELEIRVFGSFLLPENRFFQLSNPGILKNLELLLHSNISNSDNIKVADWRV